MTTESKRVAHYKDIIGIAELYNAGTEFNNDDELVIRHSFGEGCAIADKINDVMHEKHRMVGYSLSIKHGDMTVVVRVEE
jgi:hypothetical protein